MWSENMSGKKKWEVYIIETESGTFYTGITTDIERRFREHSGRRRGASFFNFSEPYRIVHREKCRDRSSATIREIEIKKMKRSDKLALIKNSQEIAQ